MEKVASMPATIPPIIHSTSSTQPKEDGSSNRQIDISKVPKVEIIQTYEKGKRMFFSPTTIRGVLAPEATLEQRQTMDQPPSHDGESPLQHHDEQAPLEVEMVEHVKDKSVEEIIKKKYEEIAELREAFSMENS